MERFTAVALGPGWTDVLCVPGPSFFSSGLGGQEASGLGNVVPITVSDAFAWARYALVQAPEYGFNPAGAHWPTRSLVAQWYSDAQRPTSLLSERCYYKANDFGTFDLAMPINKDPMKAGTFHDGFDIRSAHRFKKSVYVDPTGWNYRMWETLMDNASWEVIMAEVAKAPEEKKQAVRAELRARKDEWFEKERTWYLTHFCSRINSYNEVMMAPDAFLFLEEGLPVIVRTMRIKDGLDDNLNDWSYLGSDPDAAHRDGDAVEDSPRGNIGTDDDGDDDDDEDIIDEDDVEDISESGSHMDGIE